MLILLAIAFASTLVLGGGCISPRPGVDAPGDIIHFPIGVAVHPAGRYAAVVNANFNQAYRNGSVVFIDLSSYRIVSEWTQVIGIFGGEVAFNHSGTRMFVAVRGAMEEQGSLAAESSDILVAFDIDPQAAQNPPGSKPIVVPGSRQTIKLAPHPFGIAVDADDRYIYVTHLSNGEVSVLQDDTMRLRDDADIETASGGAALRRCIPDNRVCPALIPDGQLCAACGSNEDCGVTRVVVAGTGGGLPTTYTNSCVDTPIQPGGGLCATACEVDRTLLNDDGEVVRLGCPEGYRCERAASLQLVAERKFSRGANQVALSPLSGSAYVTQTNSEAVGILRPRRVDGAGYTARVEQVAFSDGTDMRGIVFNPGGDRLYIAARNRYLEAYDKPGILIIDTSLTDDGCSAAQRIGDTAYCETNRLVDFIEVNQEPANLALYGDMLYVPITGRDELFAINITQRRVVATVDLAPDAFVSEPGIFRVRSRPYDLAVFRNDAGAWALVSNFHAHELAVVRLFDADGRPIHRVERKIENRAKLYEEDQF